MTTPNANAGMSSDQLENLLRKHFSPPHFAFLNQVRNGTGFSRTRTRTADALAMGTWPSRGIHLHGIEIKVDYRDFKREVANPEKAEEIAAYCHFWWLAVSHAKVAPLNEVPPNWGLLVVNDEETDMQIVRQAALKKASDPYHALLAAILRNVATNYVNKHTLDAWKDRTRAELEESAQNGAKYIREQSMRAAKESTELVGRIEEVLGCRITEWTVDRQFAEDFKLAAAIRQNTGNIISSIERLISTADTMRGPLEALLASMRKQTEIEVPETFAAGGVRPQVVAGGN